MDNLKFCEPEAQEVNNEKENKKKEEKMLPKELQFQLYQDYEDARQEVEENSKISSDYVERIFRDDNQASYDHKHSDFSAHIKLIWEGDKFEERKLKLVDALKELEAYQVLTRWPDGIKSINWNVHRVMEAFEEWFAWEFEEKNSDLDEDFFEFMQEEWYKVDAGDIDEIFGWLEFLVDRFWDETQTAILNYTQTGELDDKWIDNFIGRYINGNGKKCEEK